LSFGLLAFQLLTEGAIEGVASGRRPIGVCVFLGRATLWCTLSTAESTLLATRAIEFSITISP
jgi:hypothetical protein